MSEPAPLLERPEQDSVGFEVAREILTTLVGYATGQIDHENAKAEPDRVAAESWRTRAHDWATQLRELQPTDIERIQVVLNEHGALLRTLREQHDL